MRYNFCTLFDSYYLTRGLVLYNSLEATCEDFHLYIFAFDDKCDKLLRGSNLRNATIISLKEFESEDLLRVKPTRTIAEYCWTCTPSIIWFSIKKYSLKHCTYIDADIMFFSSPAPVFKEIGNYSVGITPHNYLSKLKSSEIYGKYCVQFVYFKNDEDGLKILDWWRESCINWCFAKLEDGKYGDQKYLDYFHIKSKNVYEITNAGAGIAPWNIGDYVIESSGNNIKIFSKRNFLLEFPLLFYHFQGLKFYQKDRKIIVEASVHNIPKIALENIYKPYVSRLITIKDNILGDKTDIEEIIFNRGLKTIVFYSIKNYLRSFVGVMKLYFFLQKKRYNRPKGIETEFL